MNIYQPESFMNIHPRPIPGTSQTLLPHYFRCVGRVLAIFIVFALNGLALAQGGPISGGSRPVAPPIGPAAIASALEIAANAGANTSNTTIKSVHKPSGMTIADIRPTAHDAQGNPTAWEVRVYLPTFKQAHGMNGHPGISVNEPYGTGALGGVLLHELAHKCDGDDSPKANDIHSCSHIAIRFGTSAQICEIVQQLIGQSPPSAEALGKAKGLCAVHLANQRVVNTPEGAEAAKKCRCGTPPYTPPSNCPGMANPPPPPGGCPDGSYPGFVVIPDCPACNGL